MQQLYHDDDEMDEEVMAQLLADLEDEELEFLDSHGEVMELFRRPAEENYGNYDDELYNLI